MTLEFFGKAYYFDDRFEAVLAGVIYLNSDNRIIFEKLLTRYNIDFLL